MKKFVIYSALYGDKDIFHDDGFNFPNVDKILFTDNPEKYKLSTWKAKEYDPRFCKHPRKKSKYVKMFPHELLSDYECSFYMDSNFEILKNGFLNILEKEFVNRNGIYWMCMEQNSAKPGYSKGRDTVKDVVEAIYKNNWLPKEIIQKQLDDYVSDGLPLDFGPEWMTGVITRRHMNEKVISFNEQWWGEIEQGISPRDTLPAMYLTWKLNVNYKMLSYNMKKYLRWRKHKIRTNINEYNDTNTFDEG